jgi:hypothetical protein
VGLTGQLSYSDVRVWYVTLWTFTTEVISDQWCVCVLTHVRHISDHLFVHLSWASLRKTDTLISVSVHVPNKTVSLDTVTAVTSNRHKKREKRTFAYFLILPQLWKIICKYGDVWGVSIMQCLHVKFMFSYNSDILVHIHNNEPTNCVKSIFANYGFSLNKLR